VYLIYDATVQDYIAGIDCLCTTPSCDTSPTSCIEVHLNDYTCVEVDIAVESDVCYDCRICSTASLQIEIEADNCFTEDLGCVSTLLISSVPGSSDTPTPSPFPSTIPPTQPFTTVPPTDPLSTVPPTGSLTTAQPPTGAQVPSPIIGVTGSGGSGAIGYAPTGALALVSTAFVTLALNM
jgi:hypothetical protein